MVEKALIALSAELAKRLDEVVELLDFGSREELVESVVRRFLDEYRLLTCEILN